MDSRVLIVGGGPVGLTLTLVLARFGVQSLVIEARLETTPRDESRAITWQPRGIELLEWLGLREAVAEAALSRTRHAFRVGSHDRLMLHLDEVDSAQPYTLDLPQGDSERLLEAAAIATGLVELRRGHRAVAAAHGAQSVRADVAAQDGRSYSLEAPWGVLCDGYHSPMRKMLGIDVRRIDYGADSAVADVVCASPILPDGLSNIVLDARRPYGFFHFGRDRWRMIYRINPGEDRAAMVAPERVLALVRERAPHARIDRVLWASAFRLGQQQSYAYRQRRWLLAGDAAHGMGPSAGAGMQIGALGAWRLGWRLAHAAAGHPLTEGLLDDYAIEQRAASDQVQASNALIFRNLALRSPALAVVRNAALHAIGLAPAIARRMTADMTLVAQRLPVAAAHDRPGEEVGWRSVRTSGVWRVGRRAPVAALSGALARWPGRAPPQHFVLPFGRSVGTDAIGRLAEKMPFPATIGPNLSGVSSPSVAIVRPDQEVVAILQTKT